MRYILAVLILCWCTVADAAFIIGFTPNAAALQRQAHRQNMAAQREQQKHVERVARTMRYAPAAPQVYYYWPTPAR